MTKGLFTGIFIVSSASILITLEYYGKLEPLSKFMIPVLLIAYYAGQFSAKYPKENKQ